MREEGEQLIIESVPPKFLLAMLATLAWLDEIFSLVPGAPLDPVEF